MSDPLIRQFVAEANSFLDDIWREAEELGYKRSVESDSLRLVSHCLYDFCEAHGEDIVVLQKNFGYQLEKAPSSRHLGLGYALIAFFLAVTEGYSIKNLILAYRILESSKIDKADGAFFSAEMISKALSYVGKKGAVNSHKENMTLKNEAHEYWVNHINRSISNDSAAILLARQYPLKQRTLSRYVSEWKKLPSGG